MYSGVKTVPITKYRIDSIGRSDFWYPVVYGNMILVVGNNVRNYGYPNEWESTSVIDLFSISTIKFIRTPIC